MISFNYLDIIILISFILGIIIVGIYSTLNRSNTSETYLLNGRSVGLLLFIFTNVSTWYGGVLGISEFTYNYGLVNILIQGIPYYFYALIFAIFFTNRIKKSNLYTIPEKISSSFDKKNVILSSIFIFLLVNPAPYLLMIGNIISYSLNINIHLTYIISIAITIIYQLISGYKSDLYTDVFFFFIMFFGLGIAVIFLINNYGIQYLQSNLPSTHKSMTGTLPFTTIIIWFIIALWTFVDPGFHQRVNSAKNVNTAKYGIIISIFLWFLFDLLTTSFGLFSKALLKDVDTPMNAFLYLGNQYLPFGIKGLFFIGLLATILSTFNSFLFLSGTTFSRDLVNNIYTLDDFNIIKYTRIGLKVTCVVSYFLIILIPSVIELWYTIGSFTIPGLLIFVFSSYFPSLRINNNQTFIEVSVSTLISIFYYLFKNTFQSLGFYLEPMLIGIISLAFFHLIFFLRNKFHLNKIFI